jgi:hypothetical protein
VSRLRGALCPLWLRFFSLCRIDTGHQASANEIPIPKSLQYTRNPDPMPPFTAVVHTSDDALRLGRTLEMMLPCSEILIVDHHSSDTTLRVAREYGARIITVDRGLTTDPYLEIARNDWGFCIQPGESINENLQSSLFEWSLLPHEEVVGRGYSVFVREQGMDETWTRSPAPEVRLVSRKWNRWQGKLPAADLSVAVLEGELLHFAHP